MTVATEGRGNLRMRAFTGDNLDIRVFTPPLPNGE